MQPEQRLRPTWLFRGRDGAWDALAAAITEDPTQPVRWPIAPSGPSMSDGDTVLLWRSGRRGGIAAICTVIGEPEAQPRPDGPPEVVIGLRIDRALGHPIAPVRLVQDPVLRPLAFMDLLETTEHRVTPRQEEALSALLEQRDDLTATDDPDGVRDGSTTTLEVPDRLAPLVRELLFALGSEDAPPIAPSPTPPVGAAPTAAPDTPGPTDLQLEHAEELARRHGGGTFTVDEAAAAWRTGVGTARSRVERLVDSGLMVRAGTLRPEERPGIRTTRGRPPVLYRLAAVRPPTH